MCDLFLTVSLSDEFSGNSPLPWYELKEVTFEAQEVNFGTTCTISKQLKEVILAHSKFFPYFLNAGDPTIDSDPPSMYDFCYVE